MPRFALGSLWIAVATLIGSLHGASVPAKAAAPATPCDILASAPGDPDRVAPGVANAKIDLPAALAACAGALATDSNNARLQFELGRVRMLVNWPTDRAAAFDQAEPLYRSAAKQGYRAASKALADLYEEIALSIHEPGDAAMARVQRAADSGDADALYALAVGADCCGDQAEAVRLYRKASDAGRGAATADLAVKYFFGRGGLQKDPAEAALLLKRAAASGEALAQARAAAAYDRGGFGLPLDEAEAARLYKLASDQGDAYAQEKLGEFYDHGHGGLPVDAREAARLFALAAEQDNSSAEFHLALYELNGTGGLARDEAEALRQLRRAAANSNSEARDQLAKMGVAP